MQERFSEQARAAMARANLEAGKLDHDYLAPFHLMLGILSGRECVAVSALEALDIEAKDARKQVLNHVHRGIAAGSFDSRGQTNEMKEITNLAVEEARKFEEHCVGTEHLVLAMSDYETCIPAQVLREMGISAKTLRAKIMVLLETSVTDSNSETTV